MSTRELVKRVAVRLSVMVLIAVLASILSRVMVTAGFPNWFAAIVLGGLGVLIGVMAADYSIQRSKRPCEVCGARLKTIAVPLAPPRFALDSYPPKESVWVCSPEHLAAWMRDNPKYQPPLPWEGTHE